MQHINFMLYRLISCFYLFYDCYNNKSDFYRMMFNLVYHFCRNYNSMNGVTSRFSDANALALGVLTMVVVRQQDGNYIYFVIMPWNHPWLDVMNALPGGSEPLVSVPVQNTAWIFGFRGENDIGRTWLQAFRTIAALADAFVDADQQRALADTESLVNSVVAHVISNDIAV